MRIRLVKVAHRKGRREERERAREESEIEMSGEPVPPSCPAELEE